MGPVVLLAMIALYSAMQSTLQIGTANSGTGAGSFDAPSPGHSPLVGLPLRIPANATLLPPLPEASGVPPRSSLSGANLIARDAWSQLHGRDPRSKQQTAAEQAGQQTLLAWARTNCRSTRPRCVAAG